MFDTREGNTSDKEEAYHAPTITWKILYYHIDSVFFPASGSRHERCAQVAIG
jgi:hypothetical protein